MKKNIFLFLAFLLTGQFAFSQGLAADPGIIDKIKAEEQNHSQLEWLAHELTDVIGPRLTNSPGYARAVKWTTETFRKWALQHAGPEAWGVFGQGWSTEHVYMAIKKPYYQPLVAYPQAWTKGTNGQVSGKVLVIDKLDSATINRLGDTVRGRIIMRRPSAMQLESAFVPFATRYADSDLAKLGDDYMFTRAQIDSIVPNAKAAYETKLYLTKKGALALLGSNPHVRDNVLVVQGEASYFKQYPPILPEIAMSREDYLKVYRLAKDKAAGLELELDMQNKFYEKDTTGYNVIAEIPGTDPKLKNQVVMLGGHLDSWHSATGATDNAAGCIVMMEAIRILQALHVQPRRTIRIALWGGEEQGPYGSYEYVRKHFGNPTDMKLKPEQKDISAYFNLDNGTGKIRGIYLQNNDKVRDIFSEWLKPFAGMGASTVTMANTGSTDHLSFDAVGIPAFQFIQDPMEYETRTHHSSVDTYEHLFMDDLKQASIIVASFVYHTAMRDELLPRKPLPKAERFVFDTDFPF